MKKLVFLVLFCIYAQVASAALEMTLSNYNVQIGQGGTGTVDLFLKDNGIPIQGEVLGLFKYCRETFVDRSYAQDLSDIASPPELSIIVPIVVDSLGKATISFVHDGSETGLYHYTIANWSNDAAVTGDVTVVPEPATIVVLGLGAVLLRLRRIR